MSYKENRKLCLIFLVFFIYPAISILHFYLTNVLPACLCFDIRVYRLVLLYNGSTKSAQHGQKKLFFLLWK